MIYIYDLMLNFNTKLINFYEWKSIKNRYFRKVPLFRIDSSIMNNIFNKRVKIEKDFLKILVGKSEEYNLEIIKRMDNICLFTDTYEVIGVMFDDKGNIIKRSKLYISDEMEVLEVSTTIKPLILNYEILGNYKNYKSNKLDNKISSIINSSENDFISYLGYDLYNIEKISKNELLNIINKSSSDEKKVFLDTINSIIK